MAASWHPGYQDLDDPDDYEYKFGECGRCVAEAMGDLDYITPGQRGAPSALPLKEKGRPADQRRFWEWKG